ncbi:MAG: hypothetical protein AB1420_13285 [Bacillota bacterium]
MISRGNFEGKSIPNLIGKDLKSGEGWDEQRAKLFLEREKRIHLEQAALSGA